MRCHTPVDCHRARTAQPATPEEGCMDWHCGNGTNSQGKSHRCHGNDQTLRLEAGWRLHPHSGWLGGFDFWCKLIEADYHGICMPQVACSYVVHDASMLATSTNSNLRWLCSSCKNAIHGFNLNRKPAPQPAALIVAEEHALLNFQGRRGDVAEQKTACASQSHRPEIACTAQWHGHRSRQRDSPPH